MLTSLYIKHLSSVKIAPAEKIPSLVKEEGEYKYDPKKDPERELIIDQVTDQLQSIHYDKQLQVKKLRYFVFCSISNVVGIIFTIWGLSLTVLFDSQEKNLTVFYCSFIFYIPFLMWIKVLCLPDFEEYRRRQYVVERRNWRDRVKVVHYRRYMGWDVEKGDAPETEEEREKRFQEERARATSLKIGKNVPKLGQGDTPKKRKDYSSINSPKRALNIVVDRRGNELVIPPPIIPDPILQTGTATKIPEFTPNKYNRYKFTHPDPEGEEFGIEKREEQYKIKRGGGVTFNI